MARCSCCSAPLPANTNRCNYCNSRSDVDLHAKHPYRVEKSVTHRICPNCDKALQTIRLKFAEPLFIERCHNCFGLFFDKGELETVLQHSVSNVYGINHQHIDNINKDRYHKPQKIRYLKCPECRRHMNRVNFGKRSGVVVDHCIVHGVWLDSGELTHLLEWKKAGGQLLQQEHAAELEKQKQRQKNVLPSASKDYSANASGNIFTTSTENVDLVETVVGLLIDKIF
jgi:Zn-finger nucleic acid-binding protein